MRRRKKKNNPGRVCIVLNRIHKEMLMQLADDERKSFSAIFRDGLDLYFQAHIERKKVLSEYGL